MNLSLNLYIFNECIISISYKYIVYFLYSNISFYTYYSFIHSNTFVIHCIFIIKL